MKLVQQTIEMFVQQTIYMFIQQTIYMFVQRGRESLVAMSLRHTETNHRLTESSLPDRHTVHETTPYRTPASAIQNNFVKHWFMCLKKDFSVGRVNT